MWTTFVKENASVALPDVKKRGGSDHPRLPGCDLIQLSVHENVLHWRPTQPR